MNDIFLIATVPSSLRHLTDEARALGHPVFSNAKGDAATIRGRGASAPLTNWHQPELLPDDPSHIVLERLGCTSLFCVSHHRKDLPEFRELLELLVSRHGFIVGSDHDDFEPMYSAANLADLFLPEAE